MTRTGRNDPCPCGSGRKFKQCHGKAEANANPLLRLLPSDAPLAQRVSSAPIAVTRAELWDVDLAPVMMFIESDPAARPAAVIVATAEVILRCDLVAHPPAELDGAATLLADAIGDAIGKGAVPPSIVRVRRADLAEALREPLLALGVPVVMSAAELVHLDEFLTGLRRQMTSIERDAGAMSNPATWAAWGFDSPTLATILDSAAAFHAAVPWRGLTDSDVIRIDSRDNTTTWYACVLGSAGEAFGLALYDNVEELAELLEGRNEDDAFARHTGAVVSLTFGPRSDLTPEMRKELAKTKRYDAGSQAWPSMWTLNTIGGGLSRAQVSDLVAALDAIPRFADWLFEHAEEVVEGGLVHVDAATGYTLSLMDIGLASPRLWEVPEYLALALPQGDDADARARHDPDSLEPTMQQDLDRLARYVAAERAERAPAKRVQDDEMAISLFVNIVNGEFGIPLRAFSERDLRIFLYDIFPRKVMRAGDLARTLRASLRRFFAWMEANERLSYPWASAVLRDRQAFDERIRRFPGGGFRDEDVAKWMRELYDDLDDRLMTPETEFEGVGEWGREMGFEEARLFAQLEREWMSWRDGFIRKGITWWEDLTDALVERQRKWERTPQQALGRKSPSAVVKRERSTATDP